MYINDKSHHKEKLDLDVFEDGFFESKFCEVAINEKFKVIVSEIYRVANTSKNVEKSLHKRGFVNLLIIL